MEIIRVHFKDVPCLAPTACAAGFFDGLHKGHQQLINTAIACAKKNGLKSAVLTFDPDPWTVLAPDREVTHLTTLQDKASLLCSMGIDLFYVVEFSEEFAALGVREFHDLLCAMNIRKLICGFDFTYASRGSGNAKTLKEETRFETEVISSVDEDDEKISSTRLEHLMAEGQVEKANELCGFYYSVPGVIVHGFKRGRKLGFPTANLNTSPESILPKKGVYAGYAQFEGRVAPAMINVGTNPTFDNACTSVEAYIFGIDEDLYGKHARFYFVSYLRPEIRFDSLEELIGQLDQDAKDTMPALKEQDDLFEATAKLWSFNALESEIKQHQ